MFGKKHASITRRINELLIIHSNSILFASPVPSLAVASLPGAATPSGEERKAENEFSLSKCDASGPAVAVACAIEVPEAVAGSAGGAASPGAPPSKEFSPKNPNPSDISPARPPPLKKELLASKSVVALRVLASNTDAWAVVEAAKEEEDKIDSSKQYVRR